jgi:glutaredoxin 3
MTTRTIEIFSAGCAVCTDKIAMVQRAACPSCEVVVPDMRDPEVVRRA